MWGAESPAETLQPYIGKFASLNAIVLSIDGDGLTGNYIFLRDQNKKLVNIPEMVEDASIFQLYDTKGNIKFATYDWDMHFHIHFHPEKIDWINVGFDTLDIVLSFIGVKSTSKVIESLSTGVSIVSQLKCLILDDDILSKIVSFGGWLPGPVGSGFSLASLYSDLEAGFTITP